MDRVARTTASRAPPISRTINPVIKTVADPKSAGRSRIAKRLSPRIPLTMARRKILRGG